MTNKRNSHPHGLGFCSVLALLFIALKLTGHIDWSWWWVLSPLWIGFAVGILAVFLLGLIWGILNK